VPPSYGPTYFPYPPPLPPKRNHTALIIVIVIVVLVAVPSALAAILYVMVSGLIRSPNAPPTLFLGTWTVTGGNVSFLVRTSPRPMDPSSVRFVLAANRSGSPEFGMPPPNGSVSVQAGGYALRLVWVDQDADALLGTRDLIFISGEFAPLPARTEFTLSYRSLTGLFSGEVTWSTP
jgi:hypothetical protein